jgi:hypothetical protein
LGSLAKQWHVEEQYLFARMQQNAQFLVSGGRRFLESTESTIHYLLSVGNKMSQRMIPTILTRHPEKSKVFVYMGIQHGPVFPLSLSAPADPRRAA